jgi:hypothetical protein
VAEWRNENVEANKWLVDAVNILKSLDIKQNSENTEATSNIVIKNQLVVIRFVSGHTVILLRLPEAA